jgi:hypothetical protein
MFSCRMFSCRGNVSKQCLNLALLIIVDNFNIIEMACTPNEADFPWGIGIGSKGSQLLSYCFDLPPREESLVSMYRIWYTSWVGKKPKSMTGIGTEAEALERQGKRVPAIFFRTEAGGEPA